MDSVDTIPFTPATFFISIHIKIMSFRILQKFIQQDTILGANSFGDRTQISKKNVETFLIYWRWKRRYPRTNNIRGRRTKKIDALGRDKEDEATKTAKVEDNEEEKNEYMPSLSENEESTSDVDNKEPTQTSKMATNNEWMKQKIKILEHEVKISNQNLSIFQYPWNRH